jgi:hypothetical protein
MQNRLRLTQLVHAQHFVEEPTAPQRSTNTKDWNGIVGENAELTNSKSLPVTHATHRPVKGLIGVAASKTDQYPSTLSPADAKNKRAAPKV